MLVIEARQLSKRYGDEIAVKDLSFVAPDGEVTGFIGPNGAGKTTSFRMLLGLARPTSGVGLVNGQPYSELVKPRHQIGAVLESSGFHPGRSGRNHLRVVATGAQIPTRRVDEVLTMVGLASAADRRVGGYSMGMRQRLALATALLGDPQTLILDEPTNGLDPEGVAWLRGLLRQWADEGRCVVVASHLLAEIALSVDRVVIINNAQVVHQGSAATLNARSSVRLRSANSLALGPHLEHAGATVTYEATGELTVTNLASEDIGRIAADHSIAIFELAATTPAHALETLFLGLTGEHQ